MTVALSVPFALVLAAPASAGQVCVLVTENDAFSGGGSNTLLAGPE